MALEYPANPGSIFPAWVPLTDGFGYSGQGNEVRYTGRWLAPYSAGTLNQALNLIDFKARFAAAAAATTEVPDPNYLYKQQIEQTLLPLLTSQRMSIKPTDGYQPNSTDSAGDSTDGAWNGQDNATNIIQNAPWAIVDLEWFLKPINCFGINNAYVSVQGTGEFQEMGTDRTGYCIQDTRTGGNYPLDTPGKGGISVVTNATPSSYPQFSYVPFQPLTKGYTLVEPKDTVTIEFPWVDAALVNLQAMRALRGRVNLNDILQWYAGTLLYEGSDVESALSPLGYPGYKITHHFTARDVDWNLVPILPPTTANLSSNTSWDNVSYGWATFRPPMQNYNSTNNTTNVYPNLALTNNFSSWQNRIYQYEPFFSLNQSQAVVSSLFFYGFAPGSTWYTPPVYPISSGA